MRTVLSLNNFDWPIMNELWSESPLTREKLKDRLGKEGIETDVLWKQIKELEKKGAVTRVVDGDERFYAPAISLEEAAETIARNMLPKIPSQGVLIIVLLLVRELNLGQHLYSQTDQLLKRLLNPSGE